ncbi:hypothetical protein ABZ054_13255, partial [Streptomyces sp. NPDC006324]
SWHGYGLETDWCRIEVEPTDGPEVLLDGVVDPGRVDASGRLPDRFGIPHERELDDGDEAPCARVEDDRPVERGEGVPMEPLAYAPADGPHFGAVVIELDHSAGTLAVSGAGLPTAEVCRAPGTPPESHVPIGTRAPERLTPTVDGTEETPRPAKGFLTRRSYRLEAASTARGTRISWYRTPSTPADSCGTGDSSASSRRPATGT